MVDVLSKEKGQSIVISSPHQRPNLKRRFVRRGEL